MKTLGHRLSATLLHREDMRQLWRLAFPILLGFVSFNVVGLVDTAMVASLGIQALSAVGLAQIAAACCGAVLVGLGAGVQAIVARRRGEQHLEGILTGLSAGVVVGVGVACLLVVLLYPLIPSLLAHLNADTAVVALSTPYLAWRVLALPLMGITIAFGAFWNAIGKSSYYMTAVIVMNLTNVLLNYVLIFGHWGAPAMGVTGAALATGVAILASALVHLAFYIVITRRLTVRWVWARWRVLWQMTQLATPASASALQDAAALSVTIWVIGHIGTQEIGVVNILFNVMAVAVLPAMALGTATGTLVGQSLGRLHTGKAQRWGWQALLMGGLISVLTSVPLFLFPETLLSGFIHEPAVVQLAIAPTQVTAVAVLTMNIAFILQRALYGAGESARVLRVSMGIQWLVIVPAILGWGVVGDGGFVEIWGLFTFGKSLLSAAVLLSIWRRGHWIKSAYSRLA